MAKKLVGQDGTPVKYQGQDVFSCDYAGVVKGVDLEKRQMVMTGTDETRDRDGDIIRLSGWKLENYKKNPVFLWAHNYGSVPIARAEKVIKRKDPAKMDFFLQYPTKGIYPFADMILELYAGKFINTSSVGFIPSKWEPIPEEEKGEGPDNPYGRVYTSQELLELSGCAVPSNPNALQNALKGKDFGFKQDDLVKYLYGATLIPRPLKEDDVLEEIDKSETEIVDENHIQVQVPDNLTVTVTNADISEIVTASIPPPATIDAPVVDSPPVEMMGVFNVETGYIDLEKHIPPDDPDILKDGEELKPYPNEHACRIADPGDFEKFARKNCFRKVDEKCVDYIFGIKDNKSSLQALRFDKEVWTEAAAKGVCSRVGGSFEAAKPSKEETPPEEKKSDMEMSLYTIMDSLDTINQTLGSLVESVKGFQASLTKVIEEGQRKPDVGEGAASVILGEALRQGKTKPEPTPKPSNGTNVGGGYPPESVQEFKRVLLDFAKAIQSLNKPK